MTKVQMRKDRLNAHYQTLEKLSEFLGNRQDGKKLSLKLRALEKRAHQAAMDYCNGENGMGKAKWEFETEHNIKEVEKVFGCKVPGLFVNGDARGYALKIDDEKVRDFYPSSINFHRDFGGYGILSPEME